MRDCTNANFFFVKHAKQITVVFVPDIPDTMETISISDADALGAELSQAILNAIITGESSDTTVKVAQPTTAEQISYVMKHTSSLDLKDRKAIGSILIMNDRKQSLLPSAAGTIINLDLLPTYIIGQMYEFVSYKVGARA